MEQFFGQCSKLGEIEEVEELLLRRYTNIEYIYSKEVDEFIDFVEIAINKEAEEKLYQAYLFKSIFADKNFPTFDEVLRQAKTDAKKVAHTSTTLSTEDEWKEAEIIANKAVEKFKGKGVKHGNI